MGRRLIAINDDGAQAFARYHGVASAHLLQGALQPSLVGLW